MKTITVREAREGLSHPEQMFADDDLLTASVLAAKYLRSAHPEARVFLLGQEVAPGLKLAEVGPETVVLESGGARQELRLPPRAMAAFGGAPPPPNFTLQGNMLTAPSAGASPGGRAAGGVPGQMPQPSQPQPPPPAMPAPPPGAPPAQTQ